MKQTASCHRGLIWRRVTTVFTVEVRSSSTATVKLLGAQMLLQLLLGFCRSVIKLCLLCWLMWVYLRLCVARLSCSDLVAAQTRLHAVCQAMLASMSLLYHCRLNVRCIGSKLSDFLCSSICLGWFCQLSAIACIQSRKKISCCCV